MTGASDRFLRRGRAAGALLACASAVAAILIGIRGIAIFEAHLSSWLINVTGLAPSQTVGTAVIYQLGARWAGFTITGGCSVALLAIPPFILTAALISMGRVSWIRGLAAIAWALGLLVVVNQIRLFVVASSMKWWGITTGYERSHVLIGSGITTIGLALVTLVFLIFLAREPAARRARSARDAA